MEIKNEGACFINVNSRKVDFYSLFFILTGVFFEANAIEGLNKKLENEFQNEKKGE